MTPLADVRRRISSGRLVANLVEAVERYSPSYAETAVVNLFAAYLRGCGIEVQFQSIQADDPGRANLIVRLGPEPTSLLWVGHLDTVTRQNVEPHRPRIVDGVLYGLGAADMKSGCVAALEAARALVESGARLQRGLALAFVVGEEEYGDGSQALVDEIQAPLVIVGEPTDLLPCTSHFGYMECRLHGVGKRAHAALPERGANAIHAMLAWLTQILELQPPGNGDDLVAFNPREIRGGSPFFAVAEECWASLDVHAPPGLDTQHVADLIEGARLSALRQHGQVLLEWAPLFVAEGYQLQPSKALDRVAHAFALAGLPFAPIPFRSHSDANIFYAHGMQPIVCGPGRLETAHTPDECVELAQVEQAAHLYATLFHTLCVAS